MASEDASTGFPRVGEGTVYAAYSYYNLVDYDGAPDIPPDPGIDNKLISVGSTGALVRTGTAWGPVALRVEIHAAAPPVDIAGWERVVEVEHNTPTGIVSVGSPLGETPEGLPALATIPDGWYRIRVHARGIEEGRKYPITVENAVEHHLIQLWPAHPETMDIEFPNPATREYRILRAP